MVLRHVVEGLNPQACSDAPRWRINDAATLTVEPTVPDAVLDGLRAMGHAPEKTTPGNLLFGSAQLAQRLPSNPDRGETVYAAGSDHRRDGQAVGC
jgi:gamma-glutamyltranspeptidase/glutathione hydrolase